MYDAFYYHFSAVWRICFIFQTDKLTGQCAVLQRDKRFIYYLVNIKHVLNRVFISLSPLVPDSCTSESRPTVALQVTKKRASHKPTYDSLRRSLEDMKSRCERDGVTRVSMPRYASSPPSTPQYLLPPSTVRSSLPLSVAQHRLWPGSTEVGASVRDSGTGVRSLGHLHHGLQSS